jgi:hypothetical protein
MKKKYFTGIALLTFILGISCIALAAAASSNQKPADTGPKYDAAQQVKIKGVIEDVHETPGEYEGTHLVVKTDSGTVLVYVAPAEFLKEIETSFHKGDEIAVVGARNAGTEGDEILAKEIAIGNNTTTLRDEAGVPVWVGWKAPKK